MSVSYNRVVVAGNVTRDVELKYISSGTAVADITLAINSVRKDKEETTFVDITLWARNAEVAAEFVKKGDPLLIEGRLQLDKWENQEGEKRSKMKVVGEIMRFLRSKSESNSSTPTSEPSQVEASDSEETNEEIPF